MHCKSLYVTSQKPKMTPLLALFLLLHAVTATAMALCTHQYQEEPWTNPNLATCNPVGADQLKISCSVTAVSYNFAIQWQRSSIRSNAGRTGQTVDEGGRYSVTNQVLYVRQVAQGRVSQLTINNVTAEDLGYYWCVVMMRLNPLPNPSRILHLTNFCASSTVCNSLLLNNHSDKSDVHCANENTSIILQDPSILQSKCVQPTSTPANGEVEATSTRYGLDPTTDLLLPSQTISEKNISTPRSDDGSSTTGLPSPHSTLIYTQPLPTGVVSGSVDDVVTQQLIWMSVGIATAIVVTSIVFILILIVCTCTQYKRRRGKVITVVSARNISGRRSGGLEESEQRDGFGDQHEYTEIPTFLGHLANGNTSHAYHGVEDNTELDAVAPSNPRPSPLGTYEEILDLPASSAVHRHKYDLVMGNEPSNYHRLQRNSLNPGTRVSLHSNVGPQISNTISEATDITIVDMNSQPKIEIYRSDSSSGISSSSEANDYKCQEKCSQSDPDLAQSESLYDRPYCHSRGTVQQSSLDQETVQEYGQLGGHAHPRKDTNVSPPTSNTGSQLENLEALPRTNTGGYNHLRPKSKDLTSQSEPLSEFEVLYTSPTVAGAKHPMIMEKVGCGTVNHYHVLEGPETQVVTPGNPGDSGSEISSTQVSAPKVTEYSRLDHPKLSLENGFSANETVFEVLYEDRSKVANPHPARAAVHPPPLTGTNTSPESFLGNGRGGGYDHLEPQAQAGPRHQYTSIIPSHRDLPSQNVYAQPIVSTPDLYISEKGHVYHVLESK